MATSGTVYSSKAKSSQLYVKWSDAGQSVSGNYTTVKWSAGVKVAGGNEWYSNAVKITSVYINGEKVSSGGTYSNFTSNGSYSKLSGKVKVPHNSDGTKKMTVKISGWFYGIGNKSGSDTFTLTTIPRASTVSCPSNFTAGTAGTVLITRKSSSFTHTATTNFTSYLTTGLSKTSGITTSFTYTPPLDLFNSGTYKNATTRTGKMTVQTKSGSTNIGSAITKEFTVTLPQNDNTKPTCSMGDISYTKEYDSDYGVLIAGKSKLQVTCSSSAKYSADVGSHYVSMSGGTASINSDKNKITTGYLTTGANKGVISYYVNDTRGFTSNVVKKTNPYTIVDYKKPSITVFDVVRVNETTGNIDPVNGTRLKFKVDYYCDPIAISDSAPAQNTATVKIYELTYDDANNLTRTEIPLTIVNGEYTELAAGTYAKNETYTFEVTISDDFTSEAVIGDGVRAYARTAKTLISFYQGDGITFGRLADDKGFNVAMDSTFEESLTIGQARFDYNAVEGMLKLTFPTEL